MTRRLSPTTPEPDGRRRRWIPWLVSALLHGAVLLWWMNLPRPEPASTPSWVELRPIERIERIERSERPGPPRREPPRPVPGPVEPNLEPPASGAPPARGVDPDPRARSGPPRAQRGEASTTEGVGSDLPSPGAEPTAPRPDGSAPVPGSLSLRGLRADSRSARAAGPVTRPQLPPPVGGGHRVVRQVGAARPEGGGRRDGKARSLAEAGFVPRKNGTMIYRDPTSGFVATLRPDGRLTFRTSVRPRHLPGLTEGLIAASGVELFQKQKKALLDQTFELRLQMAVAFADRNIERQLAGLYRELLQRWSKGSASEAAKRREIFERWDECEEGLPVSLPAFAEGASSELDQRRREAGGRAREIIESFIRRQLPEGSPQAYNAEQLRRLNARRRSRTRFAPYR